MRLARVDSGHDPREAAALDVIRTMRGAEPRRYIGVPEAFEAARRHAAA